MRNLSKQWCLESIPHTKERNYENLYRCSDGNPN